MPKEQTRDLLKFLKPFPKEVKELALWLRAFVWDLYPSCNELLYDNYNALVIGFAPTNSAGDAFCSLAVYSRYVNFGFNRGSEIPDPGKLLKGQGSLYRSITIKDKADLPKAAIKKLLKLAYVNSLARLKDKDRVLNGQTITKTISEVKRRPKS